MFQESKINSKINQSLNFPNELNARENTKKINKNRGKEQKEVFQGKNHKKFFKDKNNFFELSDEFFSEKSNEVSIIL